MIEHKKLIKGLEKRSCSLRAAAGQVWGPGHKSGDGDKGFGPRCRDRAGPSRHRG